MDKKELILITEISCENGKKYLLFSDGNIYEKTDDGNHKKLDKLNSESKKIIENIMERLKPAPTDVINTPLKERKKINSGKDVIIEVEEPDF